MNPARTLQIVSCILALTVTVVTADELSDRVDELFTEVDSTSSPGAAVAIVRDGKVIYANAYGMADLEHLSVLTPESVFYSGSVSKQFTAACIAMLVLDGKLSLDDPVTNFFPRLPEDVYGDVKVRHLVHHTSGVRDYFDLLEPAGRGLDYLTSEYLIDILARQRALNFEPGSRYLYSNSGYLLLSEIVEQVSGKSFAEFAQEKIFGPLGMTSSHFQDDFTQMIPNRAEPHFRRDGKIHRYQSNYEIVGPGGLFTTVLDLAKWNNAFDTRLLGDKLYDMILTVGTFNDGTKQDYAFGLSIGNYKGLPTISHSGALTGYRANFLRFPEQKFTVIILANIEPFAPGRIADQIADIYLADAFPVAEEEAQEEETGEATEAEAIELPRDELSAYVGSYWSEQFFRTEKVIEKDGALYMQLGAADRELAALSPTTFKVLGLPVEVIAEFTDLKDGVYRSYRLIVMGDALDPSTRYEPWAPTDEGLAEFAGEYYSSELDVAYELVVREGKVYLEFRNAPDDPLVPVARDQFTLQGKVLRFRRDQAGRLSGFVLDAGRARGFIFERVMK